MFTMKTAMLLLFVTIGSLGNTAKASFTKMKDVRASPEVDDFKEFEEDYQNNIDDEHEENEGISQRAVGTDAMRGHDILGISEFKTKRQDGNAGLWGRRQVHRHSSSYEKNPDVEILQKAIETALHNIEELSKRDLFKRRQHGSTGLWGKRYALQRKQWQDQEHSSEQRSSRLQPDTTGLWTGRRVVRDPDLLANDYVGKQMKRLAALKGQASQPSKIGLWGGKRSLKTRDPTKGPSNGEKVGLWGKRQHGKAGLWGRKRSSENFAKIF